MHHVVSATLIITAVIHLLPVSGVLGQAQLQGLYGVSLDDPNLVLLMQHRAVLFGLLGLYLLYAAFTPAQQSLAFIAGWVSVLSFLLLARANGPQNTAIRRVVQADLVALLALLVGTLPLLCTRYL